MDWFWIAIWVSICIVFVYISRQAYLVDIRKTEMAEMAMKRLVESHKRELASYQVLLKAERRINERLKKELAERKSGRDLSL